MTDPDELKPEMVRPLSRRRASRTHFASMIFVLSALDGHGPRTSLLRKTEIKDPEVFVY